jgi:hypothetical protein
MKTRPSEPSSVWGPNLPPRGAAVAGLLAAAFAMPATASGPPKLAGESWVQEVDGEIFHGLDVYVTFSSPLNRALVVFNTDVSLNAMPLATFHHSEVSDPDGIGQGTALPLSFGSDVVISAVDTFVTIGGDQSGSAGLVSFTCGTPIDIFVTTTSIDSDAGWFKMPPCGPTNTAGPDLRVLIARFVLKDADWEPGASLTASWTLAWEKTFWDYASFATVSGTFEFDDALMQVTMDEPGVSYEGPANGGGSGGGGGSPPPFTPPPVGTLAEKEIYWSAPSNWIVGWKVTGMTVGTSESLATQKPSDLMPAGTADLDGDGDRDLLWIHPTTGMVTGWIMADGVLLTSGQIGAPPSPAADWEIVATADMTGDGRDDLVWRRIDGGSGAVRVWEMDGLTRVNNVQIGISPGFAFLTMSELNDDGKADLIWRLPNGSLMAWIGNGIGAPAPAMISGGSPVQSHWHCVAAPDLDGDGDRDLLWRNQNNGNVNGWLLEGTAKVGGGLVAPAVGPMWDVADVRDVDADGDDDVVWRNLVTHTVNLWKMSKLVKTAGGSIGGVTDGWTTLK